MDPAIEAYLMELGEEAWDLGLTVIDYLYQERITLDYGARNENSISTRGTARAGAFE